MRRIAMKKKEHATENADVDAGFAAQLAVLHTSRDRSVRLARKSLRWPRL
jgi:hypothetical protein